MFGKKLFCLIVLFAFTVHTGFAGISIVRSSGITLTGIDGINYVGTSGITLTGVDSLLSYRSNGITLTGVDGVTLTGVDGATRTGADGVAYTGSNGLTAVSADGITLTGADGITLTGVDGITLTGVDGTVYRAESMIIRQPNGITLTGVDGITLTGVDGVTRNGADGITLTGADGITLTGVDGITLTGADSIIGTNAGAAAFNLVNPSGITLTGVDGVTMTGGNGITLTGVDGITLTGVDNTVDETGSESGLQSVDPDLALLLNRATDDSGINSVIAFHRYPTQSDLDQLRSIGILGGTLYRVLPLIMVTTTRQKLIAASRLPNVRSIYGNRTLTWNSDPYFKTTQVPRVSPDRDLQFKNNGTPISGRGVTVAVLDTGINGMHGDLAGKVVQNVRLADVQGAPIGFINPMPIENVVNTDLISGHGTFVSGVIAGSGISSGGKYNGVAPGANLLGLSAGDVNLSYVLAGFDYLLERGGNYNARVVNCSFSSNAAFDYNDPVNIATKMLTERGVNVVVSAGNTGDGNGTLNPYAVAPWVVSVGATDNNSKLADFSSRGRFGNAIQNPTIVAPGVNVVSLRSLVSQTSLIGLSPLGADLQRLSLPELPFYTTASGTSFSAPQVAGAIALMLEANPDLTPAQVKEILQETATPLPRYYRHEVGSGMLNTYAAVLEAAFPERKMGMFRAVMDRGLVEFSTSSGQIFENSVSPGSVSVNNISVPADTVQAGIGITWGLSLNDLGLKVTDAAGNTRGTSNDLNLPGIGGRMEKVVLDYPDSQVYRAIVQHTGGIGLTSQRYNGSIELTRVSFFNNLSFAGLTTAQQSLVKDGLRSFILVPEGKRFYTSYGVSRAELASTIVRGGLVPQYMSATPMFTDIKDLTTRNIVESAQANPGGKLFFDASPNGRFEPYNLASRLVTAVALVRAANMESAAAGAILPFTITDRNSIPAQWRGHVALALQKGWLSLDGGAFNPNHGLTGLELAQAVVKAAKY